MTQTIGAVVIFFLFKWQYVFGVVPLQCDFVLIEGKITAVTNALLISLVVILNIVVYVKTKYYARPDRTLFVSFVNNHQLVNLDDGDDEPRQVAIHLVPTNSTDGIVNISNGNQQRRSESVPLTMSTTRTDINNAQNHNTTLQVHGGNRRIPFSLR